MSRKFLSVKWSTVKNSGIFNLCLRFNAGPEKRNFNARSFRKRREAPMTEGNLISFHIDPSISLRDKEANPDPKVRVVLAGHPIEGGKFHLHIEVHSCPPQYEDREDNFEIVYNPIGVSIRGTYNGGKLFAYKFRHECFSTHHQVWTKKMGEKNPVPLKPREVFGSICLATRLTGELPEGWERILETSFENEERHRKGRSLEEETPPSPTISRKREGGGRRDE